MQKIKISPSVIIASGLLFIMAGLMVYQASQWTTTMDESPHIVSGYSYLKNQDYRLNPEHPPLIKMIAGFPLLFQDLNFPHEHEGWTNGTTLEGGQWGQWSLGNAFLYWSENDPVSITFWARMGAMIVTLLTGLLLFVWAKKLYGAIVGLFTLTLFTFSPTFLAHGHLSNTDIGAVFAFLLATYYLFKYLQDQSKRNLILAGIAFGIAQLLKFSLILIIPYFFVVAVMWVIFKERQNRIFSADTGKVMLSYMGKLMMIGIIGLIVIYPVYQYTIWNYPAEMQVQDTQVLLHTSLEKPDASPILKKLAETAVWMADKPVLRSYGHFFLGHLMVFQRVTGGNTVYYLGDVARDAWVSYFPVVFMMKVPVPLLIFILLSVVLVSIHAWKKLIPIIRNKTKELSEKIKTTAR
ncbi:MAG: glycosyltransferase family 39 protein, partial [Candidatus Spechtbacterales bacterium]